MKLETYLGRFYDVNVREGCDVFEGEPGQRNIEIYERGEDCECIGWFAVVPGRAQVEWRNVYGKVAPGTMFTEAEAKAAAKAHAFYPVAA